MATTTTSSSTASTPSSFPTSPPDTSISDSPSTPRSHPTILNLPSTPSDLGADSGPSTPMSCISTIAIKDGHEGHRPNMTAFDGAAERISRLSSISAGGYFDVNKRPDTPSDAGGERSASALAIMLEDGRRKKKPHPQDSPASSVTTESAHEQRREARPIDGMTYDEGIVDTTDRSPRAPWEEEK